MRPVRILIEPLDPATNLRVEVRIADGGSADAYSLFGQNWLPKITKRPTLVQEMMPLDIDGSVLIARLDFEMSISGITTEVEPKSLIWVGAPVTMYLENGEVEGLTGYTFQGSVKSGQPSDDSLNLKIQAEVSASMIDVDLLPREFDGSGGLGGEPAVRGSKKPSGFGVCRYIAPFFYNETHSLAMLDGYGNLISIEEVFVAGNSLGPVFANYSTEAQMLAALLSGVVPAGRWVSSINDGVIGLAAPPSGIVQAHATFGSGLAGAIMLRAMLTNGNISSSKIMLSDFETLNNLVPYPFHYWTQTPRKIIEFLEKIAASANSSIFIDFKNRVRVTRAFGGQTLTTFEQNPQKQTNFISWVRGDQIPPFGELRARSARPGIVVQRDQLNFEDNIIDRGLYSDSTSYQLGNLVELADKSTWLYINQTASIGNDPPATGAFPASDQYWFQQTQRLTSLQDISPNEAAKLGTIQPGATRNFNKGFWANNAVSYDFGDEVVNNGSSWVAITNHVSNALNGPPALPVTVNANWQLRASNGTAGFSFIELTIYRQSASAPATPNGGSYNFGTKVLTPPVGWSSAPSISGQDPQYASIITASVQGATGSVALGAWSSPQTSGQNGAAAPLLDIIYIRSAAQPATPAQSAGVPAGWSGTVAAVPAGVNPIWSSVGQQISAGGNYLWDTAVRFDGDDGIDANLSPPSHSIPCTAQGIPKAGEIAKANSKFEIRIGKVLQSTGWGYSVVSISPVGSASGTFLDNVFTLQSLVTGTAIIKSEITLRATRTSDGLFIDRVFNANKSLDGSSQTSESRNIGVGEIRDGGSPAEVKFVDIVVSPGATVSASASMVYSPSSAGGGNRTIAIGGQLTIENLTDGGAPSNLTGIVNGGTASYIAADFEHIPSSCDLGNSTATGATSAKVFRIKLLSYKISGNATGTENSLDSGAIQVQVS